MRRSSLNMLRAVWSRIETETLPLECVELVGIAAACESVPGVMAEAGVYKGGTAAMLLETTPKEIHLFDTFSGLPASEGRFRTGQFPGSLEQVKHSLSPYLNRVHFHPGVFPQSARGLEDLRFSFVHLDLDLYDSTLAALDWFWPRLNLGGVLLSHDYPSSPGVVRAFSDFGRPPFPMSGQQCFLVKTQV